MPNTGKITDYCTLKYNIANSDGKKIHKSGKILRYAKENLLNKACE